MKTILEILKVIPASRYDVENWLARLELRTEYQPTVPGRARLYSWDNVVELATLAEFVKAGYVPAKAAAFAHMVVRNARHDRGNVREWFVGDVGAKGIGCNEITTETVKSFIEENGAAVAVVINTGAIVRRVDALFRE